MGTPREATRLPDAIQYQGRAVLLKYHRLLSGIGRYPPNSLSALGEILRGGARVIEFDIQALTDGHFVLLHDERLERETTGVGPVRGLTARDVKRMRLRDADEPPALLAEVVEQLRDWAGPLKVQVDLKDPRPFAPADVNRILRAIEPLRANPQIHVVAGCLADWNLRLLHRADPTLALGLDFSLYLESPIEDAVRQPPRVNAYGYADDHFLGYQRAMAPEEYLADRVETLCRLVPGATEVYLRKEFIIQALGDGLNPVETVQQALGPVVVDMWTLNTTEPDAQRHLAAGLEAGVTQITTDTAVQLPAMAGT